MKRKIMLLLVALLTANFATAQKVRLPKGKMSARSVVKQTLQQRIERNVTARVNTQLYRELSTMLNDRYLRGDFIRSAVNDKRMAVLKYLVNDPALSNHAWYAVFYHPDLTRKLVESGSIPGEEMFSAAVQQGNRAMVNLLCERGNPSAKAKHEMLFWAIHSTYNAEHLNIALDLINKFHADINPEPSTFVRYPKDRAFAPYDILSSLGRDSMRLTKELRFALEHGANPNLVFADTGNSIYYQLIVDREWGSLNILREYRAKLEGEMLEKANRLLHEKINDEAFTRVLIDAGADPNFKLDGLTPLERATQAWRNAGTEEEGKQINNVMKFYKNLSVGKVEPYYDAEGKPLYWEE